MTEAERLYTQEMHGRIEALEQAVFQLQQDGRGRQNLNAVLANVELEPVEVTPGPETDTEPPPKGEPES